MTRAKLLLQLNSKEQGVGQGRGSGTHEQDSEDGAGVVRCPWWKQTAPREASWVGGSPEQRRSVDGNSSLGSESVSSKPMPVSSAMTLMSEYLIPGHGAH